jgi:hypothetical protein
MGRRSALAFVCVAVTVVFCGCSNKTTTPTDTTPASPTITENWITVLPVGGAAFYSFSVAQKGTVNMTLVSVSGDDVPSDVALALGIGTPNGTVCSTGSTTTAGAGTSPQVTGTYDPGVYCAKVSDPGNLPAAAAIAVSIAHP